MGEYADDAVDGIFDRIEELHEHAGDNVELFERGLIDESSTMAPEDVAMLPGVEDVHSLERQLDRLSLVFDNASLRIRARQNRPEQKWQSGGKLYSPKEMTTQHLINAIAYAGRTELGEQPVINAMRKELEKRKRK